MVGGVEVDAPDVDEGLVASPRGTEETAASETAVGSAPAQAAATSDGSARATSIRRTSRVDDERLLLSIVRFLSLRK